MLPFKAFAALTFPMIVLVGACSSGGSVVPIYEFDASARPAEGGVSLPDTSAPSLCPEGETSCNGVCANFANSLSDCGSCGVGCMQGEVCSLGTCSLTCGGGTRKCGGGRDAGGPVCANFSSDNQHCGACGIACAAGTRCTNGSCIVTCGPGFTVCPGDAGPGCVNLANEPTNCGNCGTSCIVGSACVNGLCAP